MNDKVILVDCDGVLCNWEYAFTCWMEEHGFTQIENGNHEYDVAKRFSIEKSHANDLVRIFNESAAIGFLPALRDAMYYVKRLHEEHGWVFHCITSLSTDQNAFKLRDMNLKKLFGPSAITQLICLGTGADKDEILATYQGTGYYWVEDKLDNAICGLQFGLKPILIEHGFNMNDKLPKGITKVVNWKQIYKLIIGENE